LMWRLSIPEQSAPFFIFPPLFIFAKLYNNDQNNTL
jgi:hypothetical protein